MAFVMVALWVISAGLMLLDGKAEKTRWVAAIAFCGSFGALAETIKDNLRPYLLARHLIELWLEQTLQAVFNVSYVMNHIVGAYAMFVASIVYSGLFRRAVVTRLKLLLLIPVVVTIAVSPIFPVVQINWIVLAAWAVPYIFVGTGFLYRAYQRETNPKWKTDRYIVMLAISGPTVTVAFTNYIARCFGYHDLYTSNILVIGVLFLFIAVVLFKNNFLGIRLKVEKDRMDSAMQAVVSGTSILNHTIKNEMLKITMSADICRQEGLNEKQKEYIGHIETASEYLLGMTRKLQNHLQVVEIKPEETNVADMLQRIVELSEPMCKPKGISIETEICNHQLVCRLDVLHVTEVVNSLIRNAVEAIVENGQIRLVLGRERRAVVIAVVDNGKGISRSDLPFVMDPFFTTKRRTMNFGLGLTHGYNIMRQHMGRLAIESNEGCGTTVRLIFPTKA